MMVLLAAKSEADVSPLLIQRRLLVLGEKEKG
jgi:hypothetical protein